MGFGAELVSQGELRMLGELRATRLASPKPDLLVGGHFRRPAVTVTLPRRGRRRQVPSVPDAPLLGSRPRSDG